MKRLVVILLAVVIIILVVWLTGRDLGLVGPVAPVQPLGAAPVAAERPAGAIDPRLVADGGWQQQFARAVALAGGAAGTVTADPAVTELLPLATELLAAQPVSNWRRLQGQVDDGSAELPPGHTAPQPAISGSVARGALRHEDAALELRVDGLYVDRRIDPATQAGAPLRILVPAAGQYVIRLKTDDPGSLRLDGGLVAPGRWYLLPVTTTVQTAVPARLQIRPVTAVSGFHPEPIRLPTGSS